MLFCPVDGRAVLKLGQTYGLPKSDGNYENDENSSDSHKQED